MLIPFGILSAAGVQPVGPSGAYELISTTTLGTATASVTFSSLGDYSSTYKHLQIRSVGKTTVSGDGAESLVLRFNADSGSNYVRHFMQTNSSTRSSGAVTGSSYAYGGILATNSISAFGVNVCDVLDAYSTTKNKTTRTFYGSASALSILGLGSSAWLNTASITSMTLSSTGGNLNVGTRISLYGIKG
jgi:hypothetical protein